MQAVERIEAEMMMRLRTKGAVSLALCGGASPIPLYRALSRLDLDWGSVAVTPIDDRCVPPHHADSNLRLLADNLLNGAAGAARLIPLEDWRADHIPDMAIIGMGGDGHIASLFPAMLGDEAAFNPAAKPAIIKTPAQGTPCLPRITMTLGMILAIPWRVLLVLGGEKQAVLKAVQSGAADDLPPDLPVGRLLAHGGTDIIMEVPPDITEAAPDMMTEGA